MTNTLAALFKRTHRPTGDWRVWCGIAIAGIILLGFRVHAFSLPLETDEANYAYIAGRLLDGDRLYVDVWDHQPPGVFVLFALATSLFGQSEMVYRWLAAGFAIATLLIIFAFTRRHYGPAPAIFAALLFAITSSDPGTAGEGCNREIYMNFLALIALWFVTVRQTPYPRQLILAGVALGIASTFKTVAAAQWLLLVIWLVARAAHPLSSPRGKGGVWGVLRVALAPMLWMAIGPAVIWLTIGLYFTATARWTLFLDAVFTFNVAYSGISEGFWRRFADFATVKPYVFVSAKTLWLAAPCAWVALIVLARRRLASTDGAIAACALGSCLAISLPGLYWPHYYYLLIPPMILVCAASLKRIAVASPVVGGALRHSSPPRSPAWQGGERGGDATRLVAFALGATLLGSVLFAELRHYLLVDPAQITAPRYDYRQQWARAQGLRVAELTDPADTIFVWGKDAGVYFYSHRRCASRYTMVGALGQDANGYARRRAILMDELRTSPPRLVLVVEPEFGELRRFLQERYVVAGVDMHDRRRAKPIMLVLMDKERPIEIVDWEWQRPELDIRD